MKLIRLNQIFVFIQTMLLLTALSFAKEYVPSANPNRDGDCPEGFVVDCSEMCFPEDRIEDATGDTYCDGTDAPYG
ncbi:uncharacterized protein METZ01_LOCUS286925, partial [marine metagenome]